MRILLILVLIYSSNIYSEVPDLSGTYDVATLTPLFRPEAYGENLYLSREEGERIAKEEAARMAEANESSDPTREAPPEGGDGSAGAAGNVGGYNAFWIDRGEDAFTLNGKFRTSIVTQPIDGRRPSFTPIVQARMAKLYAGYRRGNDGTAWWLDQEGPGPYDNMEQRPKAERCLLGFSSTGGPPMLPALYNNLKRIVQTDTHVMILAEMVHDARVIRLNAEHRPSEVRTWMGDSVGHWEGDTLVVDTTNFSDSPALSGADHNLHVVERFQRIDDGTLKYSFVVEDETVWDKPWGGDYPWPASDNKVYEYACHEGNYSFGNIMRGARILENDRITQEAAGGGR